MKFNSLYPVIRVLLLIVQKVANQNLRLDCHNVFFELDRKVVVYLSRISMSATAAEDFCTKLGGELVRISSGESAARLRTTAVNLLVNKAGRLHDIKIFQHFDLHFGYRYIRNGDKINGGTANQNYSTPALRRLKSFYLFPQEFVPEGFHVAVRFCRNNYDYVAINENCPNQYSQIFLGYSFDPSFENRTSSSGLALAKLDRFVFREGSILSTPIMQKQFSFQGLQRDGHIYIPDERIFVGAQSPEYTRDWFWSDDSLLDHDLFHVPFSTSVECQQLSLPLMYESGNMFEPSSCSSFKAYAACQLEFNVYSRQPNCDGLSLEIFWVSGNKNVDLEANNLEVNIEIKDSNNNLKERGSRGYGEFPYVIHRVEPGETYVAVLTLRYKTANCDQLLLESRTSMQSQAMHDLPQPVVKASVFRASESEEEHLCAFQWETQESVLDFEIKSDGRTVKIANKPPRTKISKLIDLKIYGMDQKNPEFEIIAFNCRGQSRPCKVTGGCPRPPKRTKKTAEKSRNPFTITERTSRTRLSKKNIFSIIISCSLISGFLSGLAYRKYGASDLCAPPEEVKDDPRDAYINYIPRSRLRKKSLDNKLPKSRSTDKGKSISKKKRKFAADEDSENIGHFYSSTE